MRLEGLSPDAAAVLKHAAGLAHLRGHAQVTPLHVAITMLSSSSSSQALLRFACLQSHPGNHFQCKALELCFNVALNRLPSSSYHHHPSFSNALVAVFKRAQAHQRRPLHTIKIEMEQFVISILDDPRVSQVMREASFSSAQVRANTLKLSLKSRSDFSKTSNGSMIISALPPWLQQSKGSANDQDNLNSRFKEEMSADNLKILSHALEKAAPWQKSIIPNIASTILRTKEDTLMLFHGPDRKGKEKIAIEVAKFVFGSRSKIVFVPDPENLFETVLENPHCVSLVELDSNLETDIIKLIQSWKRRSCGIGDAIVFLSCESLEWRPRICLDLNICAGGEENTEDKILDCVDGMFFFNL